MKKYFYTPVLVMLLTSLVTVRAQDRQEYLGLPGDNLNLFAVMDLFQNSETLEEFERELNDQNNHINNLDLNGDGYVDYIRVIDNVERNVHFIALQVAVNPRETQDVAVFTVIRRSDGDVQIQLIGDEALYGRDYIVEPIYDETPNPGYTGNRVNGQRVTVVHTTSYEVAAWPVVRFIFAPSYVVWRSPWYWDYYPTYWRPWNPFYWHHYYGYHYNYYSYYYGHYRHWHHYRYDGWHDRYYTHYHSHSPYVRTRINEGRYKTTYSRPETRKQGTELYYNTRSANNRTSVSSSGGRRTSTGSSRPVYSNDRKSTSAGSNVAGSGRRTSASSNTTRQSSSSSGTSARTSTNSGSRGSTGVTRQSSTQTSRESAGNQSGTSTSRQSSGTSRQTSGSSASRQSSSTRESSATRQSSSSGSERRSGVSSSGSQKSTSGSSASRGTSQKSSSASSGGRRTSSGSGSTKSGSESKSDNSGRSGSGRR